MKTAFKIMGIVFALALLGGVMAYLAGFFDKKIPVDFRGLLPSPDNGTVLTVEVTAEPVVEQAPGTIRARVETVISPLITATISTLAVRAGDDVKRGELLVSILLPPVNGRSGSNYQRFTPRNEMDIAVAGAASFLELEEDNATIRIARIGLAAVAPVNMYSCPASFRCLMRRFTSPW